MTPRPVYIVHCIDTEGPLHESLTATFERLRDIFHLDLEPSEATLQKLQNGTYNLNGLEAAVQRVVDPHLLAYNDTWDKVDAMLSRIMDEGFRKKMSRLGRRWMGLQLVLRRPRRLRCEPASPRHGLSQRF